MTGLIREIQVASSGTYGYRRVHAELNSGHGDRGLPAHVSVLMTLAGIYGLFGPVRVKRLRGVATADDLVNRKFHRLAPNELWVTDMTQHRTREGWLYCCAVLDAFSRRIVGWSMDSKADATLGQRVGYGHPQSPPIFRWHSACGSRNPVHVLGFRREDPVSWLGAVVRINR